MKVNYYKIRILIFFLFFVIASISMHAQTQTFRVKFNSSQEATLKGITLTSKGKANISTFGISKVDQLNEQFNSVKIKRVFPYAGKFEAKHEKYGLHLWYEITITSDEDLNAIVAKYQSLSEISIAETIKPKSFGNEVVERTSSIITNALTTTPNDPDYSLQWHYNNTGQTGGTVDADIDLPEAWLIETGSTNVIVSVHDGGIDVDHEDLAGNMWVNSDEIAGNGVDDDGNGYVDDIYGYSFVTSTGTITPIEHGTHVAGTIAAETNNEVGMAGIAGGTGNNDGVRLMSCAVFTDDDSDGFAESYVYAADNGAVISQNSWGYTNAGVYDQSILDGIDYFIAEAGKDEDGNQVGPMAGGLVIFAAGNDAADDEWYPGYYDHVLSVAATDLNDEGASYSNFGSWVEIAAPGSGVQSTLPDNEYGSMSGTSMACPHVSGVAALIVSKFQGDGLTPTDVWNRLVGTTDPLTFSGSENWGSGRLNAFNALLDEETIAPDAITDLALLSTEAVSAILTFTAPNDGPNNLLAKAYDVRGSLSPITADNFDQATAYSVSDPSNPGTTEEIEITGLDQNTTYYFAIKSSDYFDNVSEMSNVISFTTATAPIVSVTGDPSTTINIQQTTTGTGSFTLSNVGLGDLNYKIFTTYAGRTKLTSTLVYPGNNYTLSDILPASSSKASIDIEPSTSVPATPSLSFVNETQDSIIYDDGDDAADGTLAVTSSGTPVSWGSASAFTVPADLTENFMLTTVSTYFIKSESTEETTTISVYVGGDLPGEGELALSQKVQNVDGSEYMTVDLEIPVELAPGQKFWIVQSYKAVSIRLGYDEISGGNEPGTFYVFYNSTWYDLQEDFDDYSNYVWTTRAISHKANGISLSIDNGTLVSSASQNIDVTYDATDVVRNGNYNFNLFVLSNDPSQPVYTVAAIATVTGFPAPSIDVSPDTLNVVIDASVVTTASVPVTIYNEGDGELQFDFTASIEESTLHIPAVERTTFKSSTPSVLPAPYVNSSNTTTSSTTPELLSGTTSIAYGHEVYPSESFVTFYTDDPTTYDSESETISEYIYAAEFASDNYLYFNDYYTGELYKRNVETNENTLIGTTLSFLDFAYDRQNKIMYGLYYDESYYITYLYTINLTSATATEVGAIGYYPYVSLACDGNGNLYALSVYDSYIYQIDPSSGSPTSIGYVGFEANYAQSMSYDPTTGYIYLAAYNDTESRGEFRILDTETGASELIGAFPDAAEIAAISFKGEDIPEYISSITPSSGTVAPNSSTIVTINVDATKVPDGEYSKTLTIYSNDTDIPEYVLPVYLTVSGQKGVIDLESSFLDFGTGFISGKKEISLTITNNGVGDLIISEFASNQDVFYANTNLPLVIRPGKSTDVKLVFAPTALGSYNGIITVKSNDKDYPEVEVTVVGTAINPPVLEVVDNTPDITLETGESATKTITIYNTGSYPLTFSLPDTAVTLQDSVDYPPFTVYPNVTSGLIQPGGSKSIVISMNAVGLYDGTYASELVITNNDPVRSAYIVETYLHVLGHSKLSVGTTQFDFGNVYQGYAGYKSLEIENIGTKNVIISSFSSTDDNFGVYTQIPDTITPGTSKAITLMFAAGNAGLHESTLTLINNDEYGNNNLTISLSGQSVEPPVFGTTINPDPANFVIEYGDTDTLALSIINSGGSDLEYLLVKPNYKASAIAASSTSDLSNETTLTSKTQLDTRKGSPVLASSGGPDTFGYTWVDNNSGSEVTYKWIEISTIGTNLGLGGDDGAEITLPFLFPFYGEAFETVTVASNGFLTFGDELGTIGGFINQKIPNYLEPNMLIAPFWDDIEPQNGDGVYTYITDDYVIVQYNKVAKYYGTGTATFEVILYANGEIKMQYKNVENYSGVADCTVGLENSNGTDALSIVFNNTYVKNGLAILIKTPYVSGVVSAGQTEVLKLPIETVGLVDGSYESNLDIFTNDPALGYKTIPTTLQVLGEPELTVSPSPINFGDVFSVDGADLSYTLKVNAINTGADDLTIDSVTINNNDGLVSANFTTPYKLAPGDTLVGTTTIVINKLGAYSNHLNFFCDDPSVTLYKQVTVSANGINPPIIQYSPSDTLKLDLHSNEVYTTLAEVTNIGEQTLTYTAKAAYLTSLNAELKDNDVNFSDSIYYDPDAYSTARTGYSWVSDFTVANKFTVTTDVFTLTHLSALYTNEGVTDSITVQIWKGGETPQSGTLLRTQKYYHPKASDTDGVNCLMELNTPVVFTKGETFFIVINYPQEIFYPAIYAEGIPNVSGVSYYDHIYLGWTECDEGVVFKIRAFQASESYSLASWLSITPEVGAAGPGMASNHIVTVDAGKVGVGVHKGVIVYSSNDPINPTVQWPIVLTINGKPEFNTNIADTIFISEGDSAEYYIQAVDPEGEAMVFTPSEYPDFMNYSLINDSAVFALKPSFTDAGYYTAKLKVADVNGNADSLEWVISIGNKNRAPEAVGTIADKSYYLPGKSDTIMINSLFTDADNDTLSYAVLCSNDTVVTTNIDNGTLLITPAALGTVSLSIRATDSNDSIATISFNIEVTAKPNSDPQLVNPIQNMVLKINGADSTINLDNYFADEDLDLITYSCIVNNTDIVSYFMTSNDVTFNPEALGSTSAVVYAQDGRGGIAFTSFIITVEDEPVVDTTGIESLINSNGFSIYPNPADEEAYFNYELKSACQVELQLYDINGKLIENIVDEYQTVGKHTEKYRVENLTKGIYIYKISIENINVHMGKLVVE